MLNILKQKIMNKNIVKQTISQHEQITSFVVQILLATELLAIIINLSVMKVYELQYKMKNSRPIKDLSELTKVKNAKKITNHTATSNDQYLESAQDFYFKNNFKREPQPIRTHNPQMNIKHEDPSTPVQKSSNAGKSRITPEALKRSVERDYTNNLEHWRKETFKYQEQVFILERKNTELMAENNSLKYQLRLRQEEHNKMKLNVNVEKEIIPSQKVILERKIREMETQLQIKGKRIAELEIIVNVLTEKIQKLSVFSSSKSIQSPYSSRNRHENSHLQMRIEESIYEQMKPKQEMVYNQKTLSSECSIPNIFSSNSSAQGVSMQLQ